MAKTAKPGDALEPQRGRVENLKPWPKGVSGNPAGRPKGLTLTDCYRRALSRPAPGDADGRTMADLLAEAIVQKATEGDVAAAREIADRLEGRPRQSVDLDLTTHDWRELAAREGLDEEDVLREARAIIGESADDGSDA